MSRENIKDQESVVTDPTEPLWTTEDVARYLRKTANWVRDLTRAGKMPGFKVGKEWRFKKNEIKAWAEGKTSSNPDI